MLQVSVLGSGAEHEPAATLAEAVELTLASLAAD